MHKPNQHPRDLHCLWTTIHKTPTSMGTKPWSPLTTRAQIELHSSVSHNLGLLVSGEYTGLHGFNFT